MSDCERSVLIVEDEAVIAMDMAITFSEAGWTVIGPFARLEDARNAALSSRPSAAVIDLNLHGQSSLSVAEELVKKNVPVVLFTGDEIKGLPAFLADATVVSKPAHVREVLERCSCSGRASSVAPCDRIRVSDFVGAALPRHLAIGKKEGVVAIASGEDGGAGSSCKA